MAPEELVPEEAPRTVEETSATSAESAAPATPGVAGKGRGSRRSHRGGERAGGPGESGGRGPRGPREEDPNAREESEWKERVIQIRRVTKVVKGGKKMSFRAVVVVGNASGQVGVGIGKSNEVIGAIQKGVSDARKNLITVPLFKGTIPHPITARFGGSQVILRPASDGTGIIAGGAVRSVLELAGVHNILSKSRASSPLNATRATVEALSQLRPFDAVARNRGMSVREMLQSK